MAKFGKVIIRLILSWIFFFCIAGILKLYETVLTTQECTATAAQFLTRLPDDLCADALFRAIASVRTSAHKRTFAHILQAHMDAVASSTVWFWLTFKQLFTNLFMLLQDVFYLLMRLKYFRFSMSVLVIFMTKSSCFRENEVNILN